MEKTSKTVNYTPEQTAKMVADYADGVTVEAIAETLGKTVRSVVAKLSREKVYKAKTYVSKTGEAVIKKDTVADYIGEALGLSEADTESLTKANKTALKMIADFIKAEKTWFVQGITSPAFLWYNTLMNTNTPTPNTPTPKDVQDEALRRLLEKLSEPDTLAVLQRMKDR